MLGLVGQPFVVDWKDVIALHGAQVGYEGAEGVDEVGA